MVGTLVALALAAVLMYAVVRFAARNPEQANLGPSVFRFQARSLAKEIDERGPVLLKDPLNRGREVYLQHLGGDPAEGWHAIRAYAEEPELRCLLKWENGPRRFRDPCTGQAYPADGSGLTTYPATVTAGTVSVDLRTRRAG